MINKKLTSTGTCGQVDRGLRVKKKVAAGDADGWTCRWTKAQKLFSLAFHEASETLSGVRLIIYIDATRFPVTAEQQTTATTRLPAMQQRQWARPQFRS